jgi:hypothetical protein
LSFCVAINPCQIILQRPEFKPLWFQARLTAFFITAAATDKLPRRIEKKVVRCLSYLVLLFVFHGLVSVQLARSVLHALLLVASVLLASCPIDVTIVIFLSHT